MKYKFDLNCWIEIKIFSYETDWWIKLILINKQQIWLIFFFFFYRYWTDAREESCWSKTDKYIWFQIQCTSSFITGWGMYVYHWFSIRITFRFPGQRLCDFRPLYFIFSHFKPPLKPLGNLDQWLCSSAELFWHTSSNSFQDLFRKAKQFHWL